MTKERAYELQGNIAKEAIALLVIHGPSVDVTPYQKVVMLIGSVWGLPAASTQQRLDLISQEENAAAETAYPAETVHAMERKDLPINASGIETMDNIWGTAPEGRCPCRLRAAPRFHDKLGFYLFSKSCNSSKKRQT